MKYSILALLAAGATYGYDLKQAFDKRFGGLWPAVNIGQIYATLARLERDGLVRGSEVAQDRRPNKTVYELTDDGDQALRAWLAEPTPGPRLRDAFFMKLLLTRISGVGDPAALVERQRSEFLQQMRDIETLAGEWDGHDPAGRLLIEGTALHLQADLRWLDLCEERLFGGGEV